MSLWLCKMEPETSSRMKMLWPQHVLKSKAVSARQGRVLSGQGNQPGGSGFLFSSELRADTALHRLCLEEYGDGHPLTPAGSHLALWRLAI